jgi:hypothetical protein
MVVGHHGQTGIIVQLIVMVVNEHVHVYVINQHHNVREHLVMVHHHNLNYVILNHVEVLLVRMVKFLVIAQIHVIHHVQH